MQQYSFPKIPSKQFPRQRQTEVMYFCFYSSLWWAAVLCVLSHSEACLARLIHSCLCPCAGMLSTASLIDSSLVAAHPVAQNRRPYPCCFTCCAGTGTDCPHRCSQGLSCCTAASGSPQSTLQCSKWDPASAFPAVIAESCTRRREMNFQVFLIWKYLYLAPSR